MLTLTLTKTLSPWILWLLLLGGAIDKPVKGRVDVPKGGAGIELPGR